jgi:hyperosmotically inducible periplasmic protein
MKPHSGITKMILSTAIFGLTMAVPALAQDNSASPSASQSLHRAGQAAEQAGSDTVNAAKHAGEATVTAMRDTKITTKVKYGLHEDKITGNLPIHVTTVAGVVTLSGHVPSPDAAARAEQLARQTEGVKGVKDQLSMDSAKLD